ncbi:hypothetical protein [Natrialba aegyptia]|uniref:Uncharacterized protein n=1 Tax=Natrialba aegyptia DSM 13077 TaxID=1227491 RepID=M0B719_9EURY|nr:hypothetical protein [Natrialba aegyptia]ELZ06605.1 hypothetical protein C480_08543 [Natrialba aegyptia DSM 13077]
MTNSGSRSGRGSGSEKRRRLLSKRLALFGVVAVLVLTAGCLGVLGGGDSEPAEHAPAGSNMLLHVDADVLSDEDNQQLVDAFASVEDEEAVDDQGDVVSEFENETGLDIREANQFLLFANTDEGPVDESGGIIVYSDWETDAVISAIEEEDETEYEQTEFEGEGVLYEPAEDPEYGAPQYVGDLGDGRFVFGPEAPVRGALEVEYGDADPVSGDVREAYDETRDGHVTLAMSLPDGSVPENDPMTPNVDVSAFQNVSVITGVYDTDGGEAGIEMGIHADSEDDALDVKDVIDGAISMFSGSTTNDDLKDTLREIEVEQDGTTVDVSYWNDIDELVELIESNDL